MARRKYPRALLEWRRRQPPEAIMRRSTFERIKRSAAARGATDPTKVAGKAYWRTVEAKYRGRTKRKVRRR